MLSASQLPPHLRHKIVASYDPVRYPFASIVADIILDDHSSSAHPGVPPQEPLRPALSRIHETELCQRWLAGVTTNGDRAYAVRRNVFDTRFKAKEAFKRGGTLDECYRRFVREVAVPLLRDREAVEDGDGSVATDGANGDREVLFQVKPNFRCHVPGTGHLLVHKHRDADYHHQPNEVNFWLPLTPCFGANTVWCESNPGAEDYAPFECNFGEVIRFWGHSCAHFTVPNDTDHTRVSIDFRIIPDKNRLYRETYEKSHRSDGLMRFADGAYFETMLV